MGESPKSLAKRLMSAANENFSALDKTGRRGLENLKAAYTKRPSPKRIKQEDFLEKLRYRNQFMS